MQKRFKFNNSKLCNPERRILQKIQSSNITFINIRIDLPKHIGTCPALNQQLAFSLLSTLPT